MIEGNESVIRARYSDAEFFYEQDRQQPLEAFRERLGTLTFHEKLGSVGDKVGRIEALTTWVAQSVGLDADQTQQAARVAALAKNDLVTAMVTEFSGLAGIMGSYYAREGGESEAVAAAIRGHVRPVDAGDTPPDDLLAGVVAVADRLDSLVGLFGVGARPTSAADPYALRRTAYGLVHVIVRPRAGARSRRGGRARGLAAARRARRGHGRRRPGLRLAPARSVAA